MTNCTWSRFASRAPIIRTSFIISSRLLITEAVWIDSAPRLQSVYCEMPVIRPLTFLEMFAHSRRTRLGKEGVMFSQQKPK